MLSFNCYMYIINIFILLGFFADDLLTVLDFLEDTVFGSLPDGAGDLYIPIFLCFASTVSGYDLSFIN